MRSIIRQFGQIQNSSLVFATLEGLQPSVPQFSTPACKSFITLRTWSSIATKTAVGKPVPLQVKGLPALVLQRHSSTIGNRVQHAMKLIKQAPSNASHKAYDLLPTSARKLWDSLEQPSNLQRAVSLQLEAAWQRHRRKVLGGALILSAYGIWRAMRKTVSAFVDLNESLAATGLISLGAALSMAAIALLYRRHFVIIPSAVYRQAMLRLNTHPGSLSVMGAPIVSSDVRASVLTGGGLKFKGLRPKLKSRRVAMIFPLRGTERRGLVSVEAKKKRGQLKMTLLAIDVPMPEALGGEQRIYIEGGPSAYARGGVLDELRRPFLAALSSEDAIEAEEEREEELEERKAQEVAQAAEIEQRLGVQQPDSSVEPKLYVKAVTAARDFISKIQNISKRENK